MVGLPLFGREDSGTPVFKILVRALVVVYIVTYGNISGQIFSFR